jgi:outer membrane protein, heavy metal efflux system
MQTKKNSTGWTVVLAATMLGLVRADGVRGQTPTAARAEVECGLPPVVVAPAASRNANRADRPVASDHQPAGYTLADLLQISLQRNPELRQADLRVEAASGRAIQAGLYPNPQVAIEGSELGHRDGPGGFLAAPIISQELVTGGKLRLSRQAAEQETDQAGLQLLAQRFALSTAVRRSYFEVLAAQRRVEIYAELVQLSSQATAATETLVKGRQAAPLDLLQIRVELNRFRAELDAARQERVAAWRRLTAVMGAPDLPEADVRGTLDLPWPEYDFESAAREVAACHPQVRAARIGVARSQTVWQRARAEPIPNVTLGAGYQRDNVDRQDLWTFRASVPIPVFDRNQGNVLAASADMSSAAADVERVQNALLAHLATALGQYQAARQRAERYRTSVLPDAREAYELSVAAFQGGQFEYLRVLQAQRAVAETNLEYVRALIELWLAASDLAGLLLEEDWPPG